MRFIWALQENDTKLTAGTPGSTLGVQPPQCEAHALHETSGQAWLHDTVLDVQVPALLCAGPLLR